jgi:ketosteroid isomerase-like protein
LFRYFFTGQNARKDWFGESGGRHVSIQAPRKYPAGRCDAAIITGRTTGKLLVEGKEQPLLIRYTHVYVKQGGQWRMVAQHTTPISK